MKKIISIMSTMAVIIGLSISVSAKVDGILVMNTKEQKIYEYDYEDLRNSYYDLLGYGDGTLFKDYSNHISNIVAFSDTEKGYVNYECIKDEYYEYISKGQVFDIQKFIDTSDNTMKYENNVNVEVRVVKNGIVVTDGTETSSDFDVVSIY